MVEPIIHAGIQRLAVRHSRMQVLKFATLPSLEELELWLDYGCFNYIEDNSVADFAIRSACPLKKVTLHGELPHDWLIAFFGERTVSRAAVV